MEVEGGVGKEGGKEGGEMRVVFHGPEVNDRKCTLPIQDRSRKQLQHSFLEIPSGIRNRK